MPRPQGRSFEDRLVRPLRAMLAEMQEVLRPPCLDALVHSVAAALAESLEIAVWNKRYNEMGAMLLADHIRRLSDTLSLLVEGSVRNEFSRLNNIAFLLSVSTVTEAASLIIAGAAEGAARLSRTEAANVLKLRVEFSPSDVHDLVLCIPESEG